MIIYDIFIYERLRRQTSNQLSKVKKKERERFK